MLTIISSSGSSLNAVR